MGEQAVVAGVELGGTKAVVLVGRGREILARHSLPTRAPDETLPRIREVLAEMVSAHGAQALGIASFGPVRVDPAASDYGQILPTPKPGWEGADLIAGLAGIVDGPVALHTDVTAAALAEARWGAARGAQDHIYVTIGTGIGMGIIAGGEPVTGRMHPEAGHMLVPRVPGDDFAGNCPFHGDCLEGLANGPAIAARMGRAAETLAQDDPAWALVADAIAAAFTNLFLTTAPELIVLGGGVGVGQPQLLPMIRAGVVQKLAGYLPFIDPEAVARAIVPAELGNDAGPLGALLLAHRLL